MHQRDNHASLSQIVNLTLDWWNKLLQEAGVDTFVTLQALLSVGKRPTRAVALARRRLAERMAEDVGAETAERWLRSTTAWSRWTLRDIVNEALPSRRRDE